MRVPVLFQRRTSSLRLILCILLSCFWTCTGLANASITLPEVELELTWDVRLEGGGFVYEYTITDIRGDGVRTGRITVAEDQATGHAGQHDEIAIVSPPGSVFARDVILSGVPAHNYDWTHVTIPPNGSVTVGFTDPDHGPRSDEFGILIGDDRVTVLGVPVPASPVWELSLQVDPLNPDVVKNFAVNPGTQRLQTEGTIFKYFLTNTGNVPIGDHRSIGGSCPNNPNIAPLNHVDFYVDEHVTHRGIHDEDFMHPSVPDNDRAVFVGRDSPNRPADIRPHHIAFEELGNGTAGCWLPGDVLIVGWRDPNPQHVPARVAAGGRIVGSEVTGVFSEDFELVDAPRANLPIPMLAWPALTLLSLLLALGGLYFLRSQL